MILSFNSEICGDLEYGYIEGSFIELTTTITLDECIQQVFDFDEDASGMAWYMKGFTGNCYAHYGYSMRTNADIGYRSCFFSGRFLEIRRY